MTVAPLPAASIRLRGHEPTPARVELVRRTRRTRVTRTLLVGLATLVLAPVVALLPPHVPWALAVLGGGGYLARRQWTGEFEVRSFSGTCPRCGAELSLDSGARIGLPHPLTCYQCHHEPTLVVDPLPG